MHAPPTILRATLATLALFALSGGALACTVAEASPLASEGRAPWLADDDAPDASVASPDATAADPALVEPAAAAAPVEAPPAPAACPAGMALVEGDYCPNVRQDCKRWLEDPAKFSYARCAEFEPTSTCVGAKERRRFCVDVDEYTGAGEALPAVQTSWTAAKTTCAEQGKRLCTESEWQFACEGPEAWPYPYGFVRDATKCNFERADLFEKDGSLRDLRETADARGGCASPFGVRNLVGNVDEWVARDTTWGPYKSALKGGWWLAGRNRCRAATVAHDEYYKDVQTGFRCCAEAS